MNPFVNIHNEVFRVSYDGDIANSHAHNPDISDTESKVAANDDHEDSIPSMGTVHDDNFLYASLPQDVQDLRNSYFGRGGPVLNFLEFPRQQYQMKFDALVHVSPSLLIVRTHPLISLPSTPSTHLPVYERTSKIWKPDQ